MAVLDLEEVKYNDGKCFLALIILKVRSIGIGWQLMKKMRDYFRSINCGYVVVDFFVYN